MRSAPPVCAWKRMVRKTKVCQHHYYLLTSKSRCLPLSWASHGSQHPLHRSPTSLTFSSKNTTELVTLPALRFPPKSQHALHCHILYCLCHRSLAWRPMNRYCLRIRADCWSRRILGGCFGWRGLLTSRCLSDYQLLLPQACHEHPRTTVPSTHIAEKYVRQVNFTIFVSAAVLEPPLRVASASQTGATHVFVLLRCAETIHHL